MITFFSTGKAFRGHDGLIQRNALASWKLLHPEAEVILFGDDEGAAEVCAQLGLRHEPQVEKHESGTKRLDSMFRRASELARYDYLCYANCDIVLMQDFRQAFEKTRAWREKFLLVSQRWDLDVTQPIEFVRSGWAEELRQTARARGVQQNEHWIDVFGFRKGMYREMPPLIVGHCYWDNWMIWKALEEGVPVVDASRFVMPVHQNHGYSKEYGRVKGAGSDALSQFNLQLIGGPGHAKLIRAATHRLTQEGDVVVNSRRFTDPMAAVARRVRLFAFYRIWRPAWHFAVQMVRRNA